MGRMIDSSAKSPPLAVVSSPVRQNVTFAVNYSFPEIERFVKTYQSPTPCSVIRNSRGEDQPSSELRKTNKENNPAWMNRGMFKMTNTSPADVQRHTMTKVTFEAGVKDIVVDRVEGESQQRRPRREMKPKEIAREKNRVKYDMNVVPGARRSREFVEYFGSGWHTGRDGAENRRGGADPVAFTDNASVVWIPSKRAEWEDCVSEMTAVCTSAAARRRVVEGGLHKPFYAPLSKDYIRDRVDIDDPLEGYQIRHKGGGWLQGFILWTNFTTWTHYFKWDSLHSQSGISGANDRFKVDAAGTLSAELEAQPRSGDPLAGGVVFSSIAEISLLGGIGCGEYLLRMALDDIVSRSCYKYVVLQATDSSRSFYERFGFVRVGAVSTYGSKEDVRTVPGEPNSSDGIVGYRHWTYAHESSHSLDMHGGPSYMMALRLPSPESHDNGGRRTFLEQMKSLAVSEKPRIMQLGGPSTPALKKPKAPLPNPYLKPLTVPSRRKRNRGEESEQSNKNSTPSTGIESARQSKRRKPNPARLMTPPPPGKSLTYAQKQYQSVWLAVPPSIPGSTSSRKPPRRRKSCPASMSSLKDGQRKRESRVSLGRSSSTGTPRKSATVSVNGSATRNFPQEKKPANPSRSGNRDKSLRKQRVLNIARSPTKVYFYNKVVTPKNGKPGEYYFVLHYNEDKSLIRIIPLVRQGELVGKREGRPRYKAVVENHTRAPFVPTSDYDIVPAYMVTKTPILVNETWDILV